MEVLPLSKYKVTAEREKKQEQSNRWRDIKKNIFFLATSMKGKKRQGIIKKRNDLEAYDGLLRIKHMVSIEEIGRGKIKI